MNHPLIVHELLLIIRGKLVIIRVYEKNHLSLYFTIFFGHSAKSLYFRAMQGKNEYMTNEQSAFPHFLIRFTRAIQRNEKSWDALFCFALAVAPLRVIARNEAIQRVSESKL